MDSPRMYDLRVGSADAPEIAIECVGAVDPQRTETWNIGPARGSKTLDLHGDWSVVLQPSANVTAVRKEIERILQRCEAIALFGFTPVDWWLRRQRLELYEALSALRIESIHCLRIAGAGRLDLEMTGIGGSVDEEGRALPGTKPPDLPVPVTAVWLTYGPRGIRWNGQEWLLFDASVDEL